MKAGDLIIWAGTKNLKMYTDEFEVMFLVNTKEYFERKAILWLSEYNCVEYLEAVERALNKEETNAAYWLEDETKPKMLSIVERALIENNA